jgi:hypothetical protein
MAAVRRRAMRVEEIEAAPGSQYRPPMLAGR